MRILCITDQLETSDHSSIEGIFGNHLKSAADVKVAYFSRLRGSVAVMGDKIVLPYRLKRRGLCEEIDKRISLRDFDCIIVRNFFPVLRQMINARRKFGYRLGFWHSFPHSYRRYFEARQERHARLRKALEYQIVSRIEKYLAARCDFLLVISDLFKKTFYPEQRVPYLALPMGVNFAGLPERSTDHIDEGAPLKLIYTGTVDHLRQTEWVIRAICDVPGSFVLDIFTQSINETVDRLRGLKDARVTIHAAIPRHELLQRMLCYDLGIGLIPDNALYRVSSPTKTLEYYAIGLPALLNPLPEYLSLFDANSAFFCEFERQAIQAGLRAILGIPKRQLLEKGLRGQEIVRRERDYKVLSEKLAGFISQQIQ